MTGPLPLFGQGAQVRVVRREVSGHCRAPHYVRGREGVVERVCGPFRNPESLGHGGGGLPERHLYRVRFDRRHLWPGAEGGTVDVEVYEHWLQGARAMSGHPHDHGHPHEPIEGPDAPFTDQQYRAAALRELLIERGVFTAADVRREVEAMEQRGPAGGQRVVARAWSDDGFRGRLLADAPAAVRELGIDIGPTHLVVVENTAKVHNVIVCTLCSCYPRMLLGLPPDWYKSRPYRSRVVREPRAVLAEFGTELPGEVEVRVHDSTADLRYMVLPARPDGTDGWAEDRLASLASRDAMIGVTLAG